MFEVIPIGNSLQFRRISRAAFHESFDRSAVARVRNKNVKRLVHACLRELKVGVKLMPELVNNWLSSVRVELNIAQTEGVHHVKGGLEPGL